MNIVGAKLMEQRLLAAIDQYMDRAAFEAAVQLEDIISQEATQRLGNVMNGFVEQITKNGAPGSVLPLNEQLRYLKGVL